MKKILCIIATLLIGLNCVNAQEEDSIASQTDSLFLAHSKTMVLKKSAADSAYSQNDFATALEIYENILKENYEAAEIYYNLGNTYFKMNNMAKAILNYERALLLSPNDNNIRFNLELAQSKTVDKISPQGELFIVSWIKSLINLMSVYSWSVCAVVFFIVFIVSLLLFVFSKKRTIKKVGFTVAFIAIVVVIVANLFANYQKDLLTNRQSAIVMVPSVTVKSTPSESGTDLFIIHEGHKVKISDDSMREWKEIELEDGNVGWVQTTVLEII